MHGDSGFLEQPEQRQWDYSSGAMKVRRWEGPTSALATFIAGSLPGGWHRFEIDDDSELATITVYYAVAGTDGVGEESGDGLVGRWWELDGNDLEKSLWSHPKMLARTRLYSVAQMAALRLHLEEILDGTATGPFVDPIDAANTDAEELVYLMSTGVEAFTVSQYVLRKTEIVREGTSLSASHSNVNKVFDYTALTTAEPSLADYDLVASADLTALVWLKRTPDVRPTQNSLYEIITEYWGAEEWDTLIYETAT